MSDAVRISSLFVDVTKVAALVCFIGSMAACTDTSRFGGQPEAAATPPPAPPAAAPPPAPAEAPPVDLAGKWKLSGTNGACLMTLTDEPGATDGKIAPAGGCPGNFFTSRKWTYEHGALVVRDFKGQALAELSFANGHFEGQASGGGAMTLARP